MKLVNQIKNLSLGEVLALIFFVLIIVEYKSWT
ncbi:hypothetical protein VPH1220G2_0002 [Vibrio phage 1220 g2]